MIFNRIFINGTAGVGPVLTSYAFPHEPIGPKDAIIIVPGGAYHHVCADREGESVAIAYAARGLSAFVLEYTVPPSDRNQPLLELSRAMEYLKKHADEYSINPDRIFVIGFSAGGHMVGTFSTMYNEAEKMLGLPEDFLRPAGTVYSYPVVTAMCETHVGTYENLLGKPFSQLTDEEKTQFSNELHVTRDTPPAFIWHTANDASVVPYGSLRLAESYARAGVNVELHLYPKGPHGMALALAHTGLGTEEYEDLRVAKWLDLSVEWMKNLS